MQDTRSLRPNMPEEEYAPRRPKPKARSHWDIPIVVGLCAACAGVGYVAAKGPKKERTPTVVESEQRGQGTQLRAAATLVPALARIESVGAYGPNTQVVVEFTTPVSKETAEEPASYTIEPDVKVEKATLGESGDTVALHTSALDRDKEYQLTVKGVGVPSVKLAETRARFRYQGSDRLRDGLLALYTFNEGEGDVIHDSAHVGEPLDLWMVERGRSAWAAGALELKEKRHIASDGFAAKITDACRKAKALSIEAWIKTAKRDQYSSPEIVLLGRGKKDRNFSLSQEGPGFLVRLRTTKSSKEGEIFQMRDVLGGDLTHVAFTRDANGNAKLYVNGETKLAKALQGDFTTWDRGYRLLLGPDDEYKKGWEGHIHLLAIYGRALSAEDVKHNLAQGPEGEGGAPPEKPES